LVPDLAVSTVYAELPTTIIGKNLSSTLSSLSLGSSYSTRALSTGLFDGPRPILATHHVA